MIEDSSANPAEDVAPEEYDVVLRGWLSTQETFDDSEVDNNYNLDDAALFEMARLMEAHLGEKGYSGSSVTCHEDDSLIAIARDDGDGRFSIIPGDVDSSHVRQQDDSYTFIIHIEIEVELTVASDSIDQELDDEALTDTARTDLIEKVKKDLLEGGWSGTLDDIEVSVSS